MEKADARNNFSSYNNNNNNNNRWSRAPPESHFPLQWGNRKRLRCFKIQVKDDTTDRTSVRVHRHILRLDKDSAALLGRPSQRCVLRNSEGATETMKGQSNGLRTSSPEKLNGAAVSPEAGQCDKMGVGSGGGSSSGSEADVWPKFTIGLTTKEKEEDFLAIKGSKLPQRPKKRAKLIQRTINLVSPGLWLCDLTLERYEVREKKIAKKILLQRPRGLKDMGNMESDSE